MWPDTHGKFAGSFAWWSLSLEDQFYFVLPIVIFLIRLKPWRKGKARREHAQWTRQSGSTRLF
jgi:peptidoglycan/LPS O-acetylase OafA/YrhL